MLSKISKSLITKVRANQVCFPTYSFANFLTKINLSAVRPRRCLKKFRQF